MTKAKNASHDQTIDAATRIERLLQINIVFLVILATSLLAMGQQNATYAVVAAVAAISGLYIADVKRYFQLNADATTVAAVFACAVLVVQVIRNAGQSQLLNVANILIYLEVILLFQKKEYRSYWSLIALSLLQVIVAAALNLGLAFGILMGVYIIAAFCALMLLFIVSETRPFLEAEVVGRGDRASRLDELMATSDTPPGPNSNRLMFLGRLPTDTVQQIASRAFLVRLAKMTIGTAAATVVAFLVIPRYSNSAWQGAQQEQSATVGFTEEVNLDDIGRILESPEQVMRIEFTDTGGRPYPVDGEPLLRGTVLGEYTINAGKWRAIAGQTSPLSSRSTYDLASTTLQHTTLQPGSHKILFNVAPSYSVSETPDDLTIDFQSEVISFREDAEKTRGPYKYVLATTAFRNGWQRDLIPSATRRTTSTDRHLNNLPKAAFPNVTETARRVLDEQGLLNGTAFERAKGLENHFRRTGNYFYSLEINQNRNRNLDPIEDFVENHKTGHCEYFAGALTLMLRSQGIPARMIVGYKGGDFNSVGDFYIVRQLHAHAWVEAFMTLDQIPADELDAQLREKMANGAWLRLDPTPGSLDVSLDDNVLPIVTTVREFVDYCQVLWDDYVLGLNASRQYNSIYRPIINAFQQLFSVEAWRARWATIRSLIETLSEREFMGVSWLTICGVISIGALSLVFRGRRWVARRGRRVVQWLKRSVGLTKTESPSLIVYRQLETVLADSFNLKRKPSQTASEFAESATACIAKNQDTTGWSELPRQVTDMYYRIRFGAQPMGEEEAAHLSTQIHRLAAAAQGSK